MDLVLLELVCWAGLLFFFWALKEGLGQVESDIESMGLVPNGRGMMAPNGPLRFDLPERVDELIGSYRDSQIFRYAVIQGRTYQFDRVCPPGSGMSVEPDERYVAPGLVYQECNPKCLGEPKN
ncbi:hypothetical protein [Noviherbaspirillum denitrificans]|uniref:Uncharacterized protein n=1 Tax=Noviherbaspirillum denitrificans TaxID=1968433 RepID=A0A254TR12_9BURK|nr:hypothetical protein [Noviherbaspirillum denitrificans]OWW22178.1 hypothetical protein AYR66_24450 [Noviherbaspirillum denitrificans]